MERLEITRGDARQITVALTLNGENWEPPGGSTLRATAKRHRRDADDAAVWTKTTTAGISVAGNVATISLAPADTDALAGDGIPATMHCDVQVSGGGVGPWTVAEFLLVVNPDVTRTI